VCPRTVWDGIRSLDYLLTRPEVDPARIGITGRSGGGTQSAYLAAIDQRIKAAAPENYLTTFERLFQSRGPQDPEQNFYRGLARGFDQPDLVIAHAPK
jgi:cephalosporin-C deacetylase-like acetyl esterase